MVEIILGLRNPTSYLRTTIGRLEYYRAGWLFNCCAAAPSLSINFTRVILSSGKLYSLRSGDSYSSSSCDCKERIFGAFKVRCCCSRTESRKFHFIDRCQINTQVSEKIGNVLWKKNSPFSAHAQSVAPGTFEGKWKVKEKSYALKLKKNTPDQCFSSYRTKLLVTRFARPVNKILKCKKWRGDETGRIASSPVAWRYKRSMNDPRRSCFERWKWNQGSFKIRVCGFFGILF